MRHVVSQGSHASPPTLRQHPLSGTAVPEPYQRGWHRTGVRSAGWWIVTALGCAHSLVCAQLPPPPSPLPPTPPRPGSDSAPLEVGYAVWIGDVTRIDSAAQAFDASIVVVLRWRDPKLAHDGLGAKQFALHDIWHLPVCHRLRRAEAPLPYAPGRVRPDEFAPGFPLPHRGGGGDATGEPRPNGIGESHRQAMSMDLPCLVHAWRLRHVVGMGGRPRTGMTPPASSP
jgi:hypothetical protein